MTRYLAAFACLAIIGCDPTEDDTDTDTDDGVCENGVVSTYPENNAYYRDTIEVTFKAKDDNATITVSTGGTDVPGVSVWSESGKTLVFTPTNALVPETTYDVAISYECGEPDFSFTTSVVGDASTAADLIDKTYVLDLASGRFVKPAGVGPLLQQYLTIDILIGVTDANATTIEMLGALADDGSVAIVQDMCTESIAFPAAADFTENPYFSVGPDNTTISVMGYTISIDDLAISGAFAPDGTYIAGAVLAGAVDTRPLIPLIDETQDDDYLCNLVGTMAGVECEACSDGTGDFCLTLLVTNIAADLEPDLTLVERTANDIAADASCP
ncbi:MAG: hypothetical protein HN348_03880 [Proteobacteria bacterium]|jgi:hypothetical protein|nr:hypothetical protein [Pseudomonadota bacterium]